MYISYNWLKDFVKLTVKIKPEEIALKLTNHTVEVEGLTYQADSLAKVVVASVLAVEKHPQADRLRVAIVDIKSKKLNIVCGASNLAVGQLVPVALVGAILPGGLEIKEAEIRGVKSSGMICAEDELGLGKNHEGIMVLSAEAKPGESLAKYLRADDIIFEIDNKSLSNRADLLNHYGLARELSAIFDIALKPYNNFLDKFEFLSSAGNKLGVKVEAKELCSRYQALKIENIEIKESPAWIKERLIATGQRPINNVVDLTNYIMLELGQPLHVFDATKISKINVRRAEKNEQLEALDDKEYILDEEDLVIASGNKVVALAGIIGGRNSEINSESQALILEAANFKASTIRKTSQKLGLRTESSTRFEKALDPSLTETAVFRFLSLLKESCPNFKIASQLIDVNNNDSQEVIIDLDLKWLNLKIGQEIPQSKSLSILEKLGFKVTKKEQPNLYQVVVPSWRAVKEIKIKEDLVEEILRLYGYDNISASLPSQTLSLPELNKERILERRIKNILALWLGASEVYNYSFVGEDQLKKLNIEFLKHLRLVKPLNETQTMLRQSLVAGLVGNIKNNQAKSDQLCFFEIGSVFFNTPGQWRKEAEGESVLPYQEKRLGIILADEEKDIMGRLKGMVEGLLRNIFYKTLEVDFISSENMPGWSNPLAARIKIFNKEIGIVSGVNQEVMSAVNLKKPVAIAEINFSLLTEIFLNQGTVNFKELPKYPPVMRDLAFVVSREIMYNDFRKEIIGFSELIKALDLFDVYAGSKLANEEKSLAFHFTYQSEEHTLTTGEVDAIQQDLIKHLQEKFNARLRDF